MSFWSVYVPSARTNLVACPSFELNSTGWSAYGVGTTISRVTDYAAFGAYSLKADIDSASINRGVSYTTLTFAVGSTYTASAHVHAPVGAAMYIVLYDQINGVTRGTTLFTGTGTWQRVEVTVVAAASSSTHHIIIANSSPGVDEFYVDGVMAELQSGGVTTATTYIDGDRPGSIWNGAPNASTSSRSDQWRLGGTIVDFDSYSAFVVDHEGTGSATYEHVATDNGIIGGATFQRAIVQPRAFSITVGFDATSQTDYHAKRQAFLNALKPNLVSPQQPVVLRYTGSGNARIIHAHYDTGLESNAAWPTTTENQVRFIADDPYWYDEIGSVKTLSAFDTITDADYVVEQATNGTWHSLAGGLNGKVRTAIYASDGSVYVGGDFTTAYNAAGTGSPVTVNYVAKWDGSAWTALGSGFNDNVWTLELAPDGTLYAAGEFTNASYQHIAKWNGSAWSAVGSAGAGTGTVTTLKYNAHDGRLYIGGVFANWNGNAAGDGIVAWTGVAYAMLGTGVEIDPIIPTVGVYSLALDPYGNVIAGGNFTTAGGNAYPYIAFWSLNTNSWQSLHATFNDTVQAVAVDRAGLIYAGGLWTTPTAYPYLAVFNGSSWQPLGAGVNGGVWSLRLGPDNKLIVAGAFTAAGGLTLRDRTALWNGSAWEPMLIDLPGSAIVTAVAHHIYTNEVALGFDTSGSAIASNTTDVTVNNPGTEHAAPVIFINHVGTLEAILNWTTGKAIYFGNLTVRDGEKLWLDLSITTPQYMATFSRQPSDRTGPRMFSNYRGDVTRYISPNSDLATWRLLPGDNTILVKTKDALAGASFVLAWRAPYLSLDA